MQKSGDQVRITVQLINALKDDHLWADTYDRSMSNLFSVETDVAQKIAESLEAKLTGREKKEIAFVGTRNPAYDAYLRALALRGAQSIEASKKTAWALRTSRRDRPKLCASLGSSRSGGSFGLLQRPRRVG